MTLIDRAKRFIQGGKPAELTLLLSDCVSAGNSEGMLAVQILARDMYGGMTFNFELKAPAAHCLLAWRQAGLKALAENALYEPASKNFTLAFYLLSCTAGGREPRPMFLSDMQLREAVSHAVGDWNNLASAARSQLRELMLSIEDDADAALYVATALQHLALLDKGSISNLNQALALRSIAVSSKILESYDNLLAGTGDDESVFQRFFEDNPLMLDPRAFQVWTQPDLHGKLRPDFIIRTYDNNYVIVEIETPAKLLVTRQHQLGADTTHAISQVLQYQEYLRTHLTSALEAFPGLTLPAGLVIIGCESSLDAEQKAVLRAENQSRQDISIVGFDTLAETAKAVTGNVIHGIPGVITGARLP